METKRNSKTEDHKENRDSENMDESNRDFSLQDSPCFDLIALVLSGASLLAIFTYFVATTIKNSRNGTIYR